LNSSLAQSAGVPSSSNMAMNQAKLVSVPVACWATNYWPPKSVLFNLFFIVEPPIYFKFVMEPH